MPKRTRPSGITYCDELGKRWCAACTTWLYSDDFSNDLRPDLIDDTDQCVDCRLKPYAPSIIGSEAFRDLRRATKLGVDFAPVDRIRVYERDKWICHICGGRVNRRASTYAKDGATLDHVIPVSRGGSHTYDNVKLAHRGCNASKGNSLPGEPKYVVANLQGDSC